MEDKTIQSNDDNVTSIEEKKDDISLVYKKQEKRKKIKKYVMAYVVLFMFSNMLFWLFILWNNELTLMSIGDGLWLTFTMLFFIGWIMFVYNANALSSFIHGAKTFGLMFFGKRTKLSYYEYMKKIEENPIPKFYYIQTFIFSFIILIPAIIIMIILL